MAVTYRSIDVQVGGMVNLGGMLNNVCGPGERIVSVVPRLFTVNDRGEGFVHNYTALIERDA